MREREEGILGGFVELTLGDVTHQGIMITSHVILPSETTPLGFHQHHARQDIKLLTDLDSVQRTTVRYMALKDNNATKEACLRYQERAGHA